MRKLLALLLLVGLTAASGCAPAVETVALLTPTPFAEKRTALPSAAAATLEAPASAAPAASPTPRAGAQPPLLQRMAGELGTDLEALDCGQLVLAAASGTECRVYTYDRGADGLYVKTLSARGRVGKNGVTGDKREGDLCTPEGLFALGFAFGLGENPNADYPFRAVTGESYWVDDPASKHYNQWVEGAQDKDWASAERLWRAKSAYSLAVAVEYNWGAETVPGKGSAIFLHVGDEATSGCIALPAEDLTALVKWLDEKESPHILIANAQ